MSVPIKRDELVHSSRPWPSCCVSRSRKLVFGAAAFVLLLSGACQSVGDGLRDAGYPSPELLGPWSPAGSLSIDGVETRLLAIQTEDGLWECFGLQTRNGQDEPWLPETHRLPAEDGELPVPDDSEEDASCVMSRAFDQDGVVFFLFDPAFERLTSIGAMAPDHEDLSVEIPDDIALGPVESDGRLIVATVKDDDANFKTLDCTRSGTTATCRLSR